MNTQLATNQDLSKLNYLVSAINGDATLADSSKAQYIRALSNAHGHGITFVDADQLREYASDLCKSERAFLKAALARLYAKLSNDAKMSALPDKVAEVQAALWRFEALADAITVKASVGSQAHTWLSPVEVKALFRACYSRNSGNPELYPLAIRDRVAIGLMVGAGLRRDEARLARFEHIVVNTLSNGEKRAVLNVPQGKGDKARAVPLSPDLHKLLLEWRDHVGDNGLIIRAVGRDRQIKPVGLSGTSLYKLVQKRGAIMGKADLQPHDLRRTYAQIGYNAGVSVAQLQTLLGHANIETTMRYLNISLDLDCTASDFIPIA